MTEQSWQAEVAEHKRRVALERQRPMDRLNELGYDVRALQEAERLARRLVRRGQWASN